MQLTPEDVEKVALKNLANIIRKANREQTLTGRELAILEQASAGGGPPTAASAYAKTQDELAQRLGISRKTITNHQRDDGAPRPRPDGRYDVAAWSRFLRERGIVDEGGDDQADAKKNWKDEFMKRKCNELDLKMAQEQRELVPIAEVIAAAGRTASAFRTSLNQLAGRCARSIVGLKEYDEIHTVIDSEVAIVLAGLENATFLDEPGPDVDQLLQEDSQTVAQGTQLEAPATPLQRVKPRRKADRVPLKNSARRISPGKRAGKPRQTTAKKPSPRAATAGRKRAR